MIYEFLRLFNKLTKFVPSDKGMIALAEGIKGLYALNHLNLSNNNIGPEGGEVWHCFNFTFKYKICLFISWC